METLKTLQISKKTARKIFKDAPEYLREILISTFGADTFKSNVIDRIKTFEDAYEEADKKTRDEFDRQINRQTIYQTPNLSEHIVARLKLILIAKVLRGEWEPDFSNSNQEKWFPWFKFSADSEFDFSFSYCAYDLTYTDVGSRLCFPNEELSNYFGKQFIKLHRAHL